MTHDDAAVEATLEDHLCDLERLLNDPAYRVRITADALNAGSVFGDETARVILRAALSAPPAPASGTTEEVERVALAIAQRIDLEHADLEHLHVPTTGIERDDFPDREFAPYLTLARAALAALREDGTKTETGWLIERQDRGAPEWYRLVNSATPNNFWTKNAAEALRFARRADAEAYCADSGLDDPGFTVHITEHAWGP